ncbi:GntR family transcriptional regulator [Neobittarella massiliensis]|uniref:GntR family transcriptional regulator n=1 Tax=Neobittarella massiliensis (ex Bilen et al. 2018) TaxID=2041842 RepID=UPI000CF685F3|nr:GntR family transcriptional regulator [Neobittarella massiliensis]
MRQDRHLYSDLYRSLCTQIECGYLPCGQPLPSQPQLCAQYNVGITTVRRAVAQLARQGYIRQPPGQPAVVSYTATPRQYALAVLRRRADIADAFGGLGVLMPPLYAASAQLLKERDLAALRQTVEQISPTMSQAQIYSCANIYFTRLLRPFGSDLMMDLQSDAENFLRVPYNPLARVKDPSLITAGQVQSFLAAATQNIRRGDPSALQRQLGQMYRRAGAAVERYMAALARAVGPLPAAAGEHCWFVSKGRSELYLRVAMSLLRRIGGGEFSGQKYLPSIPQLMRTYHVTKDTASRAVTFLNRIGAVQTLNRRGTVVARGDAGYQMSDLSDPLVRRRLQLFAQALQIIAITAPAAAAAVVPHLSASWLPRMQQRLQLGCTMHTDTALVQVMMGCLVALSPHHALQNIYSQLNELLLWGYYLQVSPQVLHRGHDWASSGAQQLLQAVAREDGDAFVAALSHNFNALYQQVCALLAQLPPLPAGPS